MPKKTELSELISAMENNDSNIELLQNYIGEYLKTYFLLGYDNNGESIIIINGKTEQDYHSLESLIRKYSTIEFSSESNIEETNEE